MGKTATKSDSWYRVIIDNQQLVMSAGFRSLVQLAVTHVPSSLVTIDRLEVVPNSAISNLLPPESAKGLSIVRLFVALGSITQLVWGRFFFFADEADAEQANEYGLAERIAASQMTICVVDNSSCFIFTNSTSLVCELLGSELQLEVVKGDLPGILRRSEDF